MRPIDIVVALFVLTLAACSGSGQRPSDGGSDGQPAAALSLELWATPKEPIYPFIGGKNENAVTFSLGARLGNRTGREFQDLELVVAVPPELQPASDIKVTEGGYNGILHEIGWGVDWLPPEQVSLLRQATLRRDPKLFSSAAEALTGDLTITLQAKVRQYDETLVESSSVSVSFNLPGKVTKQEMEVGEAATDGQSLYAAARPSSGDNAGKGGVYRIGLASGDVQPLFLHGKADYWNGPILLDGESLYLVTPSAADPSHHELKRIKKDGSGTAEDIPLPQGATLVRGLAADADALYLQLETSGSPSRVVARLSKKAPGETKLSGGFSGFVERTLATTPNRLFVMQTDPAAIVGLDKSTLETGKLIDVGSTTGPHSLACNQSYCFWTEWDAGGLFQVPLAGGGKARLAGTNQPLVLVDGVLYSGINGLIRVGQEGSPAESRFFILGGPIPVFCADQTHVFFQIDKQLWRIRR